MLKHAFSTVNENIQAAMSSSLRTPASFHQVSGRELVEREEKDRRCNSKFIYACVLLFSEGEVINLRERYEDPLKRRYANVCHRIERDPNMNLYQKEGAFESLIAGIWTGKQMDYEDAIR